MFVLIRMLIVLLLQQGYPTAYTLTNVKPRPDMRDIGAVSINILHASGGAYVPQCTAGRINNYVIWVNPARNPMYLIDTTDGLELITSIEQLNQISC